MKNKLFTITLAALSIVLAGSCEKSDDIAPDNGSTAKVLPKGALPGEFSVSATKKVYFSKGNLYYNGISYRFEDYQWEFPNKHIGHFYWSKNASVAISGKYNESTTRASDVFFTNAKAETASNTFTVDNGAAGMYRTLSKEEWKYLFTGREDASNKYGYATLQREGTIGTVYGIILLPDYFDDPKTNKGISAFVPAPSTGWKQNIYDKDGWNAMESAGAVFLPAAGYHNSLEVRNVNIQGSYWSSSTCSDDNVYCVFFKDTRLAYNHESGRAFGYSVRLVTDAN